jgi:hypothetical protein
MKQPLYRINKIGIMGKFACIGCIKKKHKKVYDSLQKSKFDIEKCFYSDNVIENLKQKKPT